MLMVYKCREAASEFDFYILSVTASPFRLVLLPYVIIYFAAITLLSFSLLKYPLARIDLISGD